MSWTMWHVYGTGFDCAEADPEKYQKFIQDHKQILQEANWRPSYDTTLEQFLLLLSEEDTERLYDILNIGLAYPVAVIMAQETGIRFEIPGYKDYVLFNAKNPWEYNEREKNLTLDSLIDLMGRYAEDLGVSLEPDVDLIYSG